MFTYIYIVFLACLLTYSVYRDFMTYKRGDYTSYPFKDGKNNKVFNIIFIIILLAGIFIIKEDKINLLLLVLYIFIPIFIVENITYSYLVYKKTDNKKLVFNSIMYLLMISFLLIIVLPKIV